MVTKKTVKSKVKPQISRKTKELPSPKTKHRVYTSAQIDAVVKFKHAFPDSSIREIGKLSNTPKSVVQRWLKNPTEIIRKTQAKELSKSIPIPNKEYKTRGGKKVTGKEVKEKLARFMKFIESNRANETQKGKLRLIDDSETGYKVIS